MGSCSSKSKPAVIIPNTIEDVLKLMDEVEEQNKMEREISEKLIGSGAADSLSSDELMEVEEELAALEREILGENKEKEEESAEDLQLPDVPDSELHVIGETVKKITPVLAS